jgi:hypothetical protein
MINMTEKELHRLSRADLLEILVAQGRENDELKEKLERAESKLNEREYKLKQSGSIAEAALKLNNVFEAAEAAGKQYVEQLKLLAEREQKVAELKEGKRPLMQSQEAVSDSDKQQ